MRISLDKASRRLSCSPWSCSLVGLSSPSTFRSAGVWVLEPKQLDYYIQREPDRYSDEHVKALNLTLSNYVRSHARV